MTKAKKIIVAVMVSLMLILPLGATASAADLVDPNNINGIAKYFGIDMSDPESIQNAIDEIKNGGLSGIMNLFGIDIADILIALEEQLENIEATTYIQEITTYEQKTESTEPATEEETEPPTKAPPVYKPTYTPQPQEKVTEEETTEIITEEQTSEEEEEETEKTTEEETKNTEEKSDSFLDSNASLMLMTTIIFIAGLGTGIIITKKLSSGKKKTEE